MTARRLQVITSSIVLVQVWATISSAQTIGTPCDPGDVAGRPGISCQATEEWMYQPPYIANAVKGDIVMSASCGMIGGLLRQVGQRYSHTGIMTRNRVELTNSTSAENRYFDNLSTSGTAEGSEGLIPSVLKFGWPGNIRQSIEGAFEGELKIDPGGRGYWLSPFNQNPADCEGDVEPSYQLIVKPPVENEAAVRPTLEAIADEAASIRAHYRFFAYSNATVINDPSFRAAADAGWATGSDGTVCTQLIWGAARRRGVVLEGIGTESYRGFGSDMSPVSDRALPPERAADATVDGLYLYSEGERQGAAEWLYSLLYNKVYERAGAIGTFFTDAPDDLANQVTNCFASDWCGEGSEDSDRWKHPGRGVAISPDDILQWDAPPAGVYGFWEYMEYHPGSFALTYRWAASEGTGNVSGNVVFEGNPRAGATVRLFGMATTTDARGTFSFPAVPAGSYEIEASATVRSGDVRDEATARRLVRVNADRTESVTLPLELTRSRPEVAPPSLRRRVSVTGTIWIRDHENFEANVEERHEVFEQVVLDPVTKRNEIITIQRCTGGEVRIELTIQVVLNTTDYSVQAAVEARMYEGDACDSSDREDTERTNVVVASGASEGIRIDLDNHDDGGDRATVNVRVNVLPIE